VNVSTRENQGTEGDVPVTRTNPLAELLHAMVEHCEPLRRFFLVTAILMVLPVASAQTTKGSIVGRVSDPSGAVVLGASVELKNQNTGARMVAKTDSNGEYTFSSVDPGTYSLTVTGKTFGATVAMGIVLDAAQTMRQDVKMSTGNVTETVEITATSPVIETDSPEISSVIDNRQIEDTPINGRDNIFGLLALAPGVQRSNSNPLVAGSSFQGGTSATVDGISMNDIFNARIATPTTSFDSIAEFTVIGSAAPARFGRAGSQVLIVTKGGSNQFHGSVFEFNRNKDLSARGYFPITPAPNFNRNEFGGSVGGPILHNKLFFFFTVEDLRLVQSTAVETVQPSPEMLTGDLSVVNQYVGVSQIWDPTLNAYLTKATNPGSSGLCCQIPANEISPLSKYLNGFFPKPNGGVKGASAPCLYPSTTAPNCAAGSAGAATISDFIYGSETYQKNFRWSLRGDYQLTTRDHLMVRYYAALDGPYLAPDLANSAPLFGNYSGTGTLTKNAVFNYTRTLTPNMVNEFVAGYNQEHDPRESENVNINPGSLVPGVPNVPTGHGGLPNIGIYGVSGIADANSNFINSQHVYQFADNLTVVHGRHSMAFGTQYIRQRSGQGDTFNGTFSFSGCFANHSCTNGSPGATENVNVVDAFADYLRGDLFSSQNENQDFAFDATGSSYGVYAQDNWLIAPRLTLNLGLRFEKTFPFGRTVGGLANFYPNMNAGAGAEVFISGPENPNLVAEYPQPAILNGSAVGVNSHNYYSTQDSNFGPHVGFALRLNNKGTLVIRGGYALIYNYFAPFINGLGSNPPFVQSTTYQQPSGTCTIVAPATTCTGSGSNTPLLTWTNAFNSVSSTGGPALSGVTKSPKQPYNEQMNLTVEWQFIRNTALRVSYVGNLGTHLDDPYPLNSPVPQPLATGQTNIQSIRPYQPWGTITYTEFNTSSNFNQVQAAIRRRFSDLTLSFDFQFSKGLGLDAFNDGGVTNPRNIRLDYGNLDYYSRMYTVFSHIYQLPVGTGKKLLSHAGPVMNRFVSGWRASGVLTLYSGLPFSVSFTPIGTLGNYPSGRPNVVPGIPQKFSVSPGKSSLINAKAFCVPGICPSDGAVWVANTLGNGGTYVGTVNPATEFTYGNEQRNSLYGPGYANYDASLAKVTKVNSKATLELRLDAFNALNRTNFATPGNRNIGSSTLFGLSTGIQGNARELQLGARLTF
jgi:hypothetical protein